MRLRGMGTYARLFYFAVLAILSLLAILAGSAGWWFYTIVSAVLAVLFVIAGPFVLGRAWRPPAPKPTRKPVVRRRK